jgi:outer membrane protein TolC
MNRRTSSWVVSFVVLVLSLPSIAISQVQKCRQLFTADDFISQVKQYHPVAKQASIGVEKADFALLSARGNFDPVMGIDASRKTFLGEGYYNFTNPELTIPLPVGNLKTGIEQNGGDKIAPEITKGRSSYLGIELPLGNGLLLDKRRAALQQAKIFRGQSEQVRASMLNNLLLDAYMAYWQWAANHQLYQSYVKFTEAADNRMRLIRIAASQGDRALIDTMEASAQFQYYRLLQSDALLKLNNARLELSNFLWVDNDSAYHLPETSVPDSLGMTAAINYPDPESLITESTRSNPALQEYNYKLAGLEVDRKLKRQGLLPYFSLKANLLNKDYYVLDNFSPSALRNNYRWGVDFKIPLFLREARGEYKRAQLKIRETNLELAFKKRQTENKIRSYYNEWQTVGSQLNLVRSMVNSYQALLRSEEIKFAQGEGSLFMINTRETKLLELVQKQVELTLKWYKAKYSVEWSAGLLSQGA